MYNELCKDAKFRSLPAKEKANIIYWRNNTIINLWLKYNPTASIVAQDCTPCTENSEIELFKYFTKIITKVGEQYKFFPAEFDHIFSTLYRKRTFRAYGLKKHVSEDIEELQSVEIEELDRKYSVYSFEGWDWYDMETGESLSGYEPSPALSSLVDSIQNDK